MTSSTLVTHWTVDRLDDLTGRTYLITGANSGIGYHAAAHLRRAGADVIIAARSAERGQAAVTSLTDVHAPGRLDLLELDLASIASINAANEALREMTDGLDAVINNAGIMQTPQRQTDDGFELQFGTNHLGHFLLNYLVFDLVQARSGRVVPVSSVAHRRARGIYFDDPMLTHDYTPTKAYCQSKLANLLYGLELARRLDDAGSDVICATAHPGYSSTKLQSTGPTGVLKAAYKVLNQFAQSAEDGAVPEVLAAAGAEASNGGYYGPTRFGDARGPVGDSTIAPVARDTAAGERLWALSEKLLDIQWKIN